MWLRNSVFTMKHIAVFDSPQVVHERTAGSLVLAWISILMGSSKFLMLYLPICLTLSCFFVMFLVNMFGSFLESVFGYLVCRDESFFFFYYSILSRLSLICPIYLFIMLLSFDINNLLSCDLYWKKNVCTCIHGAQLFKNCVDIYLHSYHSF